MKRLRDMKRLLTQLGDHAEHLVVLCQATCRFQHVEVLFRTFHQNVSRQLEAYTYVWHQKAEKYISCCVLAFWRKHQEDRISMDDE